ncbi:MAG: EamA family transporter [Archangium sp.]|nr:EamA family transporter [Archangium sp.]
MRPIALGVLLAVASAVAFGLTIPLLSWAGAGVGAYGTAALLYAGACLVSLAQKPVVREAGAPLTLSAWPALLLMAFAGAAVAPTLLAWGLQRTGPVTGGLLLNLEAVWTVVLARVVYGEFLGRRVVAALALMTAGGLLLSVGAQGSAAWSALGMVAVLGATVGWAVDNTASRKLAQHRPLSVVALKGALGAALTSSLALVSGESLPELWRAAALLLAGATGYGLSLRLYLLAQRRIGAARTASVFALAPFIGAALGLVAAPAALTWGTGLAALLFAAGVFLHVSERHAHAHQHQATSHEHPHRHDDGHHTHAHDSTVDGEHSHPHEHEPVEHAHEHGDDVHHGHSH